MKFLYYVWTQEKKIDNYNEDEHIEDYPELDEFNNLDEEDIDEDDDK